MSSITKPTLFDDVSEKNVIFLLDTSGSMYSRLAIVKEHLKEFLHKMAFRGGCKFNMVEFNTVVTQWSDEMVQCLPETVTVASDWINNLEAKTGTNTESALLAAYNNDECEAVYLVTDGLPDSNPNGILDRVAYVCRGRPCHCIYLTGATVDKSATNFLQDLATDTYGSFMIVTVTNHGSIERITPVYKASHNGTGVIRTVNKQIYSGNQKQCSVTSTLEHPSPITIVQGVTPSGVAYPYGTPYIPTGPVPFTTIRGPHPGVLYPHPYNFIAPPRVYTDDEGKVLKVPYFNQAWAQWYQPYLWARYRTARSWLKLSDDLDGALSSMHVSPAAGALLIDRPVLARRTTDGVYYRATVKSQIDGDKFLVEFAPCSQGDFLETSYQETFVFDIVQTDDGRRHSVMKGDKVLAPTEQGGDLYEPGTVIDGQEGRETDKELEDRPLVVMFSTGKSADIPHGQAIWIDQLLYDRTAFELKLPKKTRQQIVDTISKYPEDSFPGYPVSGADKDPVSWELPRKFYNSGRDATFQPHTGLSIHSEEYENYRPHIKNHTQRTSTTKKELEREIPGTHLTESQLEEKVEAQLEAHWHELAEDERQTRDKMQLEERKRRLRESKRESDKSKDEIDRDISVLEAELKYKMKLREQAIDRKRQEIDDEIEIKVRERDQLMEDRRLLFGYPQETRLSRERQRVRPSYSSHRESSRSLSRERELLSPRYQYSTNKERTRSISRDRYHRSRSRSLSTERAPSFGHTSPRSPRGRARSLSPNRSVSFDESLNRHHRYKYDQLSPRSTNDSGFEDGLITRDSGTNTPIIRNGREIKLQRTREEKPQWKYWKADPIPDVMDPPFHEPYSQSAVAEPLELRNNTVNNGVLEWGSSQFQKVVPNGRSNHCDRYVKSAPGSAMKSVSFQDNSNVHLASGSNLVTYASPPEKKLQLRQKASRHRLQTPSDPSTYYMNGDTVGESMKDFHRERIVSQMSHERSRPSTSYTREVASTAPSAMTSTPSKTYQQQVNATSYKREVESRNQATAHLNRNQQRITAMAARREERDMLNSAKLQQQLYQEKRSAEMKRGRTLLRNSQLTGNVRADLAKERGYKAEPIIA